MAGLVAISLAASFRISISILLGLKGYKPLAFHPIRMLFLVKAFSLVGLYSVV
jgi:hypothetical protein